MATKEKKQAKKREVQPQVQVEHTGFEGFPQSQQGHVMGWQRVFEWLSGYCSAKAVAK